MPKLKVYIEKEDKAKNIDAKSIDEVFKKLKINPETVIIIKDDTVVTKDIKLKNNDNIKLLSIISGG